MSKLWPKKFLNLNLNLNLNSGFGFGFGFALLRAARMGATIGGCQGDAVRVAQLFT